MGFRVDPNLYTTIPTRSPDGVLGLSVALQAAAPPNPPAVWVERLERLGFKTDALQSAWIDANRPTLGARLRKRDSKHDRAWQAVYVGLERWPNIEHPKHAARATELIGLVFPTGLDFLGFGYPNQWAQSERRLRQIAEDGLMSDFVELAGQEFMDNLADEHKQYGDALRITKKDGGESLPIRIVDQLRALRAELANYARLVLGLTDEDDEAAVAIAEAALEPILRFRKPRAAPTDRGDELDELPVDPEAPAEPSDEGSDLGES